MAMNTFSEPAIDLSYMKHELETQDNRITSHPIYMVEKEERVHGIDPDIRCDGAVWYDKNDHELEFDTTEERDEWLREWGEDHEMDADDFVEIFYVTRWQTVQPFFTEKAAEAYIRANKHNLGRNPRIFVYSGYRNYEWQGIRALVMSGEE